MSRKESYRLDLVTNKSSSDGSDMFSQLDKEHQSEIERTKQELLKLEEEQVALENERQRVATLKERQGQFTESLDELLEGLTVSLPILDEELESTKSDINSLDQSRKLFAVLLKKLETLNPEGWSVDELEANLNKLEPILDRAVTDFEGHSEIIHQKRGSKKIPKFSPQKAVVKLGFFQEEFLRGLAFNLPLIIFGIILFLLFKSN